MRMRYAEIEERIYNIYKDVMRIKQQDSRFAIDGDKTIAALGMVAHDCLDLMDDLPKDKTTTESRQLSLFD